MLDTSHRIATPEGVELSLRLAGPVARALAWAIDFLWRFALFIILIMLFSPFQRVGTGLILLSLFALEWLVPAWFEVVIGATPGKRALGLRVLRDDGTALNWRAALTRNVLRWADFLPIAYFGGLLAMLANARFKRLGDWVAGTIVVYDEQSVQRRQIPDVEPLMPPYALKLGEQRAIIDYAERAPHLSRERAAELAALAGPLVADCPRPQAPERLLAYASHYVGRRSEGGKKPHAAS